MVTVALNTSVNSAGYDITSIMTLTGCADNVTDRISQKYDVAYHVVGGAPGAWTTLAGDAGATVVRAFTGTGGEVYGGETRVTISGITASGVDQLRFTFHGNSTQNETSLYKEIDVLGTATAAASNTYATWAAAQVPPVTGGPNGDSDHDGIANLVEYALALDPAAADGSPGSFDGSLLSFSKRDVAVTNNDVTYAIQTSTTLAADSWTEVLSYVDNNATTISCTLPDGVFGGKVFARLVVTQK